MKNLYQSETASEILQRIDQLSSSANPQWGKMNVGQMLAHCANAIETPLGIRRPPRNLLGKLIGRFIKPSYVGEETFKKNNPTDPQFKITDNRNFETEKVRLKNYVSQFSKGPDTCKNNLHPFFGELTGVEWARSQYKHLDHHLRQFNA